MKPTTPQRVAYVPWTPQTAKPKKARQQPKTTTLKRAVAAIARKPKGDRERAFLPFVDCALLIDEGGGVPVERFTDADALHYFLIWLRDQRRQAMQRDREASKASKPPTVPDAPTRRGNVLTFPKPKP